MAPALKAALLGPALGAALATLMVQRTPVAAPSPSAQPQPTSFALIDSALAARRINAETAHKYRVFAAFRDSRLPAAYQGDDRDIGEIPPQVDEVYPLLRTFSAQTQADLAPFFMRPDASGSWLELGTASGDPDDADPDAVGMAEDGGGSVLPSADHRSGASRSAGLASRARAIQWHTVPAVGGKVKVWAQLRHQGDSLKAEQIARAMTSTIWPRLVGLFWPPMTDGGLSDNGGGPALDVYLVRPDFANAGRTWAATARAADPTRPCDQSPRYLLIDSRYPIGGANSVGLLQTVAHEVTHAITHTTRLLNSDCWEFHWIDEATAQWSEDWVFPGAQSEQQAAWRFLGYPRESLDVIADKHQYGAYLFPFHLVLSGHQLALPSMWQQFATHKSLDGIDAALRFEGTRLDEVFPKFAIQNLNRPPVDDYRTADRLPDVAVLASDSVVVSAPPGGHYEKDIFMGIPYLATKYAYFVFDASVQSVVFENTLTPIPSASVWGIEKIKGQWKQPVDWTKTRARTWCRNAAVEDLEQLILVFTNTQWKDKKLRVDPGPFRPLLKAYPTGCSAWVGTVTATFTAPQVRGFGTIEETATTTARFEPDPDLTSPNEPVIYWSVVSGSVKWTARASGAECTGDFSGSMPLLPGLQDGSKQATFSLADNGNGLRYSVSLGPWPEMHTPALTWNCGSAPPLVGTLVAVSQWWDVDPSSQLASPDGKTLSGTYQRNLGAGIIKWTWSFRFQ